MTKRLTPLLLAGLVAACAAEAANVAPANANGAEASGDPAATTSRTPKQLAIGAFDALFRDYSEDGLRDVFAQDVIQHNVRVPTGRDALLGLLPVLRDAGTTYQNRRLFQDGEFAIMHNTLDNAQPFGAAQMVSFNVYRIEDGRIAEHWGVPTPVVEQPAGGPTQFDGETAVTDRGRTDAHKQAVTRLFEAVVHGTQEQVGAAVNATFAPDYINHSPGVGNGIPALFEAFGREEWVYTRNHKVLGEGNFVLAISEGTARGVPSAFYDLLRFEGGKVVEHWDVIVAIPTEGLANDNGMFGF